MQPNDPFKSDDTSNQCALMSAKTDKQQEKLFKKIVAILCSRTDLIWPFTKPVDHEALGLTDYPKIIKHPMDLGTIKQRLQGMFYSSTSQCLDDLCLMFQNCYIFNRPGEEVVSLAMRLEALFRQRLYPFLKTDHAKTSPYLMLRDRQHPLASVGRSLSDSLPVRPGALRTRSGSEGDNERSRRKRFRFTKTIKHCSDLLEEISSRRYYDMNYIFLQPVDAEEMNLPDYHKIISEPMDLSTIKNKLESGQYQTKLDFYADMCLMFTNCFMYNGEVSVVGRICREFQDLFEAKFSKVPDEEDEDMPERNKVSNLSASCFLKPQKLARRARSTSFTSGPPSERPGTSADVGPSTSHRKIIWKVQGLGAWFKPVPGQEPVKPVEQNVPQPSRAAERGRMKSETCEEEVLQSIKDGDEDMPERNKVSNLSASCFLKPQKLARRARSTSFTSGPPSERPGTSADVGPSTSHRKIIWEVRGLGAWFKPVPGQEPVKPVEQNVPQPSRAAERARMESESCEEEVLQSIKDGGPPSEHPGTSADVGPSTSHRKIACEVQEFDAWGNPVSGQEPVKPDEQNVPQPSRAAERARRERERCEEEILQRIIDGGRCVEGDDEEVDSACKVLLSLMRETSPDHPLHDDCL